MTNRKRWLAAIVIGATLCVPTQAGAFDREGMAVSRQKPKVEKTYGDPIVGNNTSLRHKPSDCRTATYCDTIPLEVNTRGFTSEDAYYINIVMSWPQQYNEEAHAQSNDLDLYIYDSQELRVGQAATANKEEKTQIDTPYTGTYYLVVNNFAGANVGYTFEVELVYGGKLKEIPKFVRPTALPSLPPAAPGTPDEAPPVAGPSRPAPPETDLEPDATLAPILTPGPDGELTTLSLEAVPTRGEAASRGLSWWAIAIAVLLAAITVGGGFLLFRRWRARAA